MRDPARIEKVTQALQKYWELMPDLRLWQVISILEDEVARQKKDPFYIEDEKWLEIIQAFFREEIKNPSYIKHPKNS